MGLVSVHSLPDIIRDDGDTAGEAMLIAQALMNPLRGVALLLDPRLILLEDLVDDRDKRIELRPCRLTLPPVTRRNRMLQDL